MDMNLCSVGYLLCEDMRDGNLSEILLIVIDILCVRKAVILWYNALLSRNFLPIDYYKCRSVLSMNCRRAALAAANTSSKK